MRRSKRPLVFIDRRGATAGLQPAGFDAAYDD